MNASVISEIFHNHANSIRLLPESSAKFRARNYDKVANIIEHKFSPTEKITKNKLSDLVLTDFMKEKVLYVIKNGKLSTHKKSTETKVLPSESKTKLIKELTELMGIGLPRAEELVKDGLKHIKQLRSKKWLDKLPIETRSFLELKPITPIPHKTIAEIESYLLKLQTSTMKIRIVGSFRRNKSQSNDIDVMITSDDDNAIDKFRKNISTIAKILVYSKGPDKMSCIISIDGSKYYKIDVFRVTKENEIPMLLYSTGSKEHNILMRKKAKSLGMLLNQKGLFKDGKKIPNLDSEEDYFKFLDMEYKTPPERI